jgi:hypothetical protein
VNLRVVPLIRTSDGRTRQIGRTSRDFQALSLVQSPLPYTQVLTRTWLDTPVGFPPLQGCLSTALIEVSQPDLLSRTLP